MRIIPLTTAPIKTQNINFNGWSSNKKKKIEQAKSINDLLNDSSIKRIAVSGHKYPDSDSIGSCFAMSYLLHKKTGQPVDVFIFGNLPQKFEYLKDNKIMNIISLKNKEDNLEKIYGNYDLAVSVDTSSSNLMNSDYYKDIFQKARYTLKVDHHQIVSAADEELYKKTNYASLSYCDSTTPSAAEVVMQLVKPLNINPRELHENFNNAVYTGILGDTGNFNHATTPLPFSDTVLLIKNGLDIKKVVKSMNQNPPKAVKDILLMANLKLKYSDDGKIAYLYKDEDISNAIKNLKNPDLEDEVTGKLSSLVSGLLNDENVEITLLFSRRYEDKLYVSSRSNSVNIRNFAQRYDGGGHDLASGFTVPNGEDINKTIEHTVAEVSNYLKEKS